MLSSTLTMDADSYRRRLRKRSSTESMDWVGPEAAARRAREGGVGVVERTRLDLPDTRGRSSFYLDTCPAERGRSRHYLSGLHNLDRQYQEMELLAVAGSRVEGWPHTDVSCCLRRHFGHVTSATECKMVLSVRDREGRRHEVEIQFEVLYEDGTSLGDRARAVFDVIVRVVDNVISTPDVTDVTYEQCCRVRVRHGALTGRFLRVGHDNTLGMEVPGSPDDYVFKCYIFLGHNQTNCRRGRRRCLRRRRSRGGGGGGGVGGGDDGSWPRLCVLQDPRTSRFVVASALSSRLVADHGGTLHTDMENIQKPDPRFFLLHQSGDGDCNQYCLTPLVLCDYFLRYDAVEGLKLTKCPCPPYRDPSVVRHFAFEFQPADLHH